MVEVESPRGLRAWVAIRPDALAGRVAEKAARLLDDRPEPKLCLSNREQRLLADDEPVIDGEFYHLVPSSP